VLFSCFRTAILPPGIRPTMCASPCPAWWRWPLRLGSWVGKIEKRSLQRAWPLRRGLAMPIQSRCASPQRPPRSDTKSSCARRSVRPRRASILRRGLLHLQLLPAPAGEAARRSPGRPTPKAKYVGHERLAPRARNTASASTTLIDTVYRLTREEPPSRTSSTWATRSGWNRSPMRSLNRDLILQPDGTITLRLLGQVHATGRTVPQLRDAIEERYLKYYKIPPSPLRPLKVNTSWTTCGRRSTAGRASAGRVSRCASRPRAPSPCRPSVRFRPRA